MNRSQFAFSLLAATALCASPARAGDVTAALKGKTLVITGSDTADDLTIINFLVLTGDGDGGGSSGDEVAVIPSKGTTINGAPDPVSFSGVLKLKVNLEPGDDAVLFDGFSFGGQVKVRGGDGNDLVTFQNCNLDDAVKLFGDANDDTFTFDATTVGGALKLKGSTGMLTMNATGSSFDSAKITGGPGADVMDWSNSTLNLNLKVNLSFGDDVVSFDDVSIGEDTSFKMSLGNNMLTCDGASQFGALLTYKGAAGDDTLSISDTDVGETANLKLGPGTNSVTLASVDSSLQVGEQLIIKGGPGDDTVTFTDGLLGAFGVGGNVKVILATGVNAVTMTGFTQLADLSITSGALDDTIALDGGEVQDDLKVLVAAGNNSVTVANTAITDDLTITAGSGDDTVDLTGTTVGGTQKVNLGGGNNTGP